MTLRNDIQSTKRKSDQMESESMWVKSGNFKHFDPTKEDFRQVKDGEGLVYTYTPTSDSKELNPIRVVSLIRSVSTAYLDQPEQHPFDFVISLLIKFRIESEKEFGFFGTLFDNLHDALIAADQLAGFELQVEKPAPEDHSVLRVQLPGSDDTTAIQGLKFYLSGFSRDSAAARKKGYQKLEVLCNVLNQHCGAHIHEVTAGLLQAYMPAPVLGDAKLAESSSSLFPKKQKIALPDVAPIASLEPLSPGKK